MTRDIYKTLNEPLYFESYYNALQEQNHYIEKLSSLRVHTAAENLISEMHKKTDLERSFLDYYRDILENSNDPDYVRAALTLGDKITPIAVIDQDKIDFLNNNTGEKAFSINVKMHDASYTGIHNEEVSNGDMQITDQNKIFALANMPEKTGIYVHSDTSSAYYFSEIGNMYRDNMLKENLDHVVTIREADKNYMENFRANLKAVDILASVLDGSVEECAKHVTSMSDIDKNKFYLDAVNKFYEFYKANGFEKENGQIENDKADKFKMMCFLDVADGFGRDDRPEQARFQTAILDRMYPFLCGDDEKKRNMIELIIKKFEENELYPSSLLMLPPKTKDVQLHLTAQDIVSEIQDKIYEQNIEMEKIQEKPKFIVHANGYSTLQLSNMLKNAQKTIQNLNRFPSNPQTRNRNSDTIVVGEN